MSKLETIEGLSECEELGVAEEVPRCDELKSSLKVEVLDSGALNNFHCILPGGFYRTRSFLESAFLPGENFVDAYRRLFSSKGQFEGAGELAEYSKIKLQQTPDEFFYAVDIALEMAGVSRDRILQKIKQLESETVLLSEKNLIIRELHDIAIPAYVVLRINGYTHRDLVG